MKINVEVPKVYPKVDQECDTVEVALANKHNILGCKVENNILGDNIKIRFSGTLAAERCRPVLP